MSVHNNAALITNMTTFHTNTIVNSPPLLGQKKKKEAAMEKVSLARDQID